MKQQFVVFALAKIDQVPSKAMLTKVSFERKQVNISDCIDYNVSQDEMLINWSKGLKR